MRDLAAGRVLIDVPATAVDRVAFSADGQRLLVASGSGSYLLDIATGKPLVRFGATVPGREGAGTAAFLSGGTQVVTNGGDGTLGVWDASSGSLVRQFTDVGDSSAAVSTDGRVMAYETTQCGFVNVVDIATRDIRGFIHAGDCVHDLALTADGTQLVLGDGSHPPRLWDVTHGTVIRTFAHRRTTINAVQLSADGREVLTGGDDGTARLFESDTGDLVRFFRSTGSEPIASVALSPDGKYAAFGDVTGGVSLSPLAIQDLQARVCSLLLRDLTQDERDDYSIAGSAPACP